MMGAHVSKLYVVFIMSCFSIIFIFSCLSDKNSTFLGVMVPDVKLSSNYQMA